MKKDYFYVGLQLLLFVLYFIPPLGYPLSLPVWLTYVGAVFAIVGAVILVLAVLQLKTNLSPFPTPVPDGQLVLSGVYAWSRHPIYTGILLMAFGYGLYASSVDRLFVGIALLLLFNFKAAYEERLLARRFPEYEAYRKEVGRFW